MVQVQEEPPAFVDPQLHESEDQQGLDCSPLQWCMGAAFDSSLFREKRIKKLPIRLFLTLAQKKRSYDTCDLPDIADCQPCRCDDRRLAQQNNWVQGRLHSCLMDSCWCSDSKRSMRSPVIMNTHAHAHCIYVTGGNGGFLAGLLLSI